MSDSPETPDLPAAVIAFLNAARALADAAQDVLEKEVLAEESWDDHPADGLRELGLEAETVTTVLVKDINIAPVFELPAGRWRLKEPGDDPVSLP